LAIKITSLQISLITVLALIQPPPLTGYSLKGYASSGNFFALNLAKVQGDQTGKKPFFSLFLFIFN
jgi:hypothetical protein